MIGMRMVIEPSLTFKNAFDVKLFHDKHYLANIQRVTAYSIREVKICDRSYKTYYFFSPDELAARLQQENNRLAQKLGEPGKPLETVWTLKGMVDEPGMTDGLDQLIIIDSPGGEQ